MSTARRTPSLFTAAVILAVFATNAMAGDAPLRLATPRFGAAAVAIGSQVYVCGGWGEQGTLDSVERIDLAGGSVTTLPARIGLRRYGAAVVWQDRIVLVGGSTGVGPATDPEVLDPRTGSIDLLPPLPHPRTFCGAAVVGHRLYVIGGTTPMQNRVGTVDIYDFKTGDWTEGPPMPTPRECTVAVIGTRIYVAGGYNGYEPVKTVEVFDTRANTWSTRPDLAAPQSAHRALADGKILYLFGDYLSLTTVAAGDPDKGTWRLLDVPFQASRHNAAALAGDRFVIAGGNTSPDPPYLDAVQIFTRAELRRAPARAADAARGATEKFHGAAASGDLALVEAAIGQMRDLQSASLKGRWTMTYEADDQVWTSTSPYELVFERPDKLYLAFDARRIWYDGHTFTCLDLLDHRYEQLKASGPADAVLREHGPMYLLYALPQGHRALLGTGEAAAFRSASRQYRMHKEREDALHGKPTWVFSVIMTNRGDVLRMPGYELQIDQASGMTLELTSVPVVQAASNVECETATEILARTLAYHLEVDAFAVNEPIPAERFAFTPDPDATPRPVHSPFAPFEAEQHPRSYRSLLLDMTRGFARRRLQPPDPLRFVLRWRTDVCAERNDSYGEIVESRIPATHDVLITSSNLMVLRLSDGELVAQVPLPAGTSAPPERALFVRGTKPSEDIVVLQRREPADPGEGSSARQISALSRSGELLWTLPKGSSGPFGMIALPAGPGLGEMVAVSAGFQISLCDRDGRILSRVNLNGQHAEFADRDADGIPELTIIGSAVACYTWIPIDATRVPPPAQP